MIGRATTRLSIERLGLFACGSASAGVHASLVAAHLREEPSLGVSFLVGSVLLVAGVIALVVQPGRVWPPRLLAVLFAGLIAGYLLTRLVEVPVLDWRREPFDALGVSTKLAEIPGLVLGLRLGRRSPHRRSTRRLCLTITPGGTR